MEFKIIENYKYVKRIYLILNQFLRDISKIDQNNAKNNANSNIIFKKYGHSKSKNLLQKSIIKYHPLTYCKQFQEKI